MEWLRLGGISLDSLLIPSTHGRKKLKQLFGDAVKQRDGGRVGWEVLALTRRRRMTTMEMTSWMIHTNLIYFIHLFSSCSVPPSFTHYGCIFIYSPTERILAGEGGGRTQLT